MYKIFALCLGLLFCSYLSSSHTAKAQTSVRILAKRASPIGQVTFGPTVNASILGPGNFVDGYVRKKGSGQFLFPVGDNGVLRPFAAEADETSGAYFQGDPGAETVDENGEILLAGGPFMTSNTDVSISKVSNKEYWDVNGGQSTKITLTWNAGSEIASLLSNSDLAKLTIVGWTGGKWVKILSAVDAVSISGESSSLTAGSITTQSPMSPSSFDVYTFGAINAGALPVVLSTFKAKAAENTTYLEWSTSSEVNNSHFEIERSAEGKVWAVIGKVISRADSLSSDHQGSTYHFTDYHPRSGSNYYRLKMVDKDLTYTYSAIREVNFGLTSSIVLFPNPASYKIYSKAVGVNTVLAATLMDLKGKVLTTAPDISKGIAIHAIPPGFYIVKVTDGASTITSQKVLIER